MGEEKKLYKYNEGMRISKIIEYLKTTNNSNVFQGNSKEVRRKPLESLHRWIISYFGGYFNLSKFILNQIFLLMTYSKKNSNERRQYVNF